MTIMLIGLIILLLARLVQMAVENQRLSLKLFDLEYPSLAQQDDLMAEYLGTAQDD